MIKFQVLDMLVWRCIWQRCSSTRKADESVIYTVLRFLAKERRIQRHRATHASFWHYCIGMPILYFFYANLDWFVPGHRLLIWQRKSSLVQSTDHSRSNLEKKLHRHIWWHDVALVDSYQGPILGEPLHLFNSFLQLYPSTAQTSLFSH
jgi:hypothetical protein